MKKLFTSISLFLASLGLLSVLSGPALAFNPFTDPNGPCSTAEAKKSAACQTNPSPCDDPISGQCGDGIFIKATNILTLVVGIAAVIIIIVGGIMFALSNGDSARVNTAKDTILYALVGLVVAALGQAIIRFVLVRL